MVSFWPDIKASLLEYTAWHAALYLAISYASGISQSTHCMENVLDGLLLFQRHPSYINFLTEVSCPYF